MGNMNAIVSLDRTHVAGVYDSSPIVFAGGESVYLVDEEGKRYIDCSAQYSACSLGHGHPELTAAVGEQLDKLVSVSVMFMTEERARLAEKLVSLAPPGLEKVLFGVTGSDANEFALKAAKYYKGGGKILSLWRSFHGSTAGSAAATGKAEAIQTDPAISSLLPTGFVHAPPPYCYRCDFAKEYPSCGIHCLDFLERTIHNEAYGNLAAIMVEPIMAAAGVIVPPEGYLGRLREIADRHNALLIFDEIVTGIARTGTMFAYEQWDVVPDILVVGKALTGGYVPGSAVIMREDIAEAMESLVIHGHTHTAYPLMCRAALSNLEIIERDDLCSHAESVGSYFLARLRELQKSIPRMGEVRGKGLLLGFEVLRDGESRRPDFELGQRLFGRFLEKGLIVELESFEHIDTSVIVFHPPLVIEREHVDRVVEIVEEAFGELAQA
jgi:4-aminobutyrate aminotransferase-like enzyme